MIQTVEKTEFHVVVVKLNPPTKHPNADSLELFDIDGAIAISKIGNFKAGDLAVYVPVDSLVPLARPEFEFLRRPGHEADVTHRLRAMRLRGIFSMGLLVPVPPGITEIGTDVAENLGVTKYVRPSEARLLGIGSPGPKGAKKKYRGPPLPVYGLDSMRKLASVLDEGELVVVTEKIHGTNARYFSENGKLWVGSHNMMRGCTPSRVAEFFTRIKLKLKTLFGMRHRASLLSSEGDVWWQIAKQYGLKERLALRPGYVLYGEIYGEGVQSGFPYDSPVGRKFRAFDVLDVKADKFLDYDDFLAFVLSIGLNPINDTVPYVRTEKWSRDELEKVKAQANTGKSLIADHMIEGLVVKPYRDRKDPRCGRVALKYVGEGYLLKEK